MYVNFYNYFLMYNILYFDYIRLLFMMFFYVYCVIEFNVWFRFLCFMVVDFKWVFKKIFYYYDMFIINLYNIYKYLLLNMFNICVNLKDEFWCCLKRFGNVLVNECFFFFLFKNEFRGLL